MSLLDYRKFLIVEAELFEAKTDFNMNPGDAATVVTNPNLQELLNWAEQNTPVETFLVDAIRAKESRFDKKQLEIKADYTNNVAPFINYAKTKSYFKIVKTSSADVNSKNGWISFTVNTPEGDSKDVVKIMNSQKVFGMRVVKTEIQESVSLIVFKEFVENGINQIADILDKIKEVWPDVEDYPDWMDSFQKQGTALKDYMGADTGFSYYRIDGFPKAVYTFVKKLGITQKDSWDPADVWMVKNAADHEKALAEIVQIDQSLTKVNDYLRSKLKSKEIIPISLKKAAKNVSAVEVNVEQKFEEENTTVSKIQCDLELAPNKKGKQGFELNGAKMDLSSGVVFYVRTTSGAFIVEGAEKGASAQLGKVPSSITQRVTGEKRLLLSHWKNKFDPDGDLGAMFDLLQKAPIVDTRCKLPKDAFLKIMEDLFDAGGDAREDVYIQKCLAMVWVASLVKMSEVERNKAASSFYYGAQKSGADFGPFIKIY